MPDIAPQPKSLEDRVLLAEAALADLQEWKKDREDRDRWLVGTVIALVAIVLSVVIPFIVTKGGT